MTYPLALDQGTRAMLFDAQGRLHASAQQEIRQIFPQPGWVEDDADEIQRTQLGVARQALAKVAISASQVVAIGIANQRETTVLWDRQTGEPLANAIVWQDRRTAPACDALRHAGHAEIIQEKTGLVPEAYFSATKLQWLLDRVPGARVRAKRGERSDLSKGDAQSEQCHADIQGGNLRADCPVDPLPYGSPSDRACQRQRVRPRRIFLFARCRSRVPRRRNTGVGHDRHQHRHVLQ